MAACAAVGPGRYQILAAINAVHTDAARAQDTDWRQIVALYDQLLAVDPTPVVALNRAIAVAEVDGPGRRAGDPRRPRTRGYHAYQAARADLLRRAGRHADADLAYRRAIELAGNPAEVAFLQQRRGELSAG